MEDILAKLLEVQHKLQKLEIRHQKLRNQHKNVDLTKISTPEDIKVIADSKREVAMAKNADLLRDLEITSGKLHTMNMCPLESKLEELKHTFLKECQSQMGQEDTVSGTSDPDLV